MISAPQPPTVRRAASEQPQSSQAVDGKQMLVTVSRELTADYGRGFSYAEIARLIQFAQAFPDEAIVVTLSQQLSWSHFHALLPIKDPLARDFYAEMCRIECWAVRTLRQKIGSMLFQRTALSKRPTSVISTEISKLRDGQMSSDAVFRDPYLLDLLGLKGGGPTPAKAGEPRLKPDDTPPQAILDLVHSTRGIEQRAAQQYRQVVDDVLHTGSRDAQHIEHTLDGLLEFCAHEPVVLMYRQLCRHCWWFDQAATAYYINAYREQWDSAEVAL